MAARRRREELGEALARVAALPTSAVRAPGRARKPSARVKVESCPHGPGTGLCRLCNWEGRTLPRPWVELPPGAPYEGKSKLLGSKVRLRGDEVDSVVVSLATPVGPSLMQTGRLSRRASCEGAVIVRTPLGAGAIETAVRKSVVRERRRLEERGQCPDVGQWTPQSLRAAVLEAEHVAARYKATGKKWDGETATPFAVVGYELPYPHRTGSSPCCDHSPVSVRKLNALVREYRESGEEPEFERAAAALRRALPRGMRETSRLETTADLEAAAADVDAYCFAQWKTGAERASETRKVFERRAKAQSKERKRLELDRGTRNSRRRQVGAGEGLGEALAALEAVSFDVAEFG